MSGVFLFCRRKEDNMYVDVLVAEIGSTTTVVNGVSKIVYQNPLNYLAGYIKAW